MRLQTLFESKQIVLPDYDGYIYKWFAVNDPNVVGRPRIITVIPGYVSFNRPLNMRGKYELVLYKFKFDREIAANLLTTQPVEPYHTPSDGYYDFNTKIKPGWLNPEMSADNVAVSATITIPLEGELIS